MSKIIRINDLNISNERKVKFILGPCVIESEEHAKMMALKIRDVVHSLGAKFIFKASFDKANRTSKDSFRGVGVKDGLEILKDIKETYDIPVLTDVHTPEQCFMAKSYDIDILQIPAFLCRQSDLLEAAGQTGLPINVKKGQFLAPEDMVNVIDKIEATGNENILLCERGTTFGYKTLINDMTGLEIMKRTSCPVIFDATHSVQKPGGNGTSTGGDRTMVPILAKAATAVGIAGIFMEVHDNPDVALSDGPNMVKLDTLYKILSEIIAIDNVVKGFEK